MTPTHETFRRERFLAAKRKAGNCVGIPRVVVAVVVVGGCTPFAAVCPTLLPARRIPRLQHCRASIAGSVLSAQTQPTLPNPLHPHPTNPRFLLLPLPARPRWLSALPILLTQTPILSLTKLKKSSK